MSDLLVSRAAACGCCEPPSTAAGVWNRPGLPALAYRVGVHGQFLRRMLGRLPLRSVPPDDPTGPRPLAALTTRDPGDPAIALLDAAAVIDDILAFYQERIANEGFLRTATERRSLLELARTIGYELRPGVAASAYLSFTVDGSPGSPGTATVPAGTRVQSMPASQGELPQTFETGVDLAADAAWNALRPRMAQPQTLVTHDDAVFFVAPDGTETEVEQLFLAGLGPAVKPGDVLLLALRPPAGGDLAPLARTVRAVTADPDHGRTRVDFGEAAAKPPPLRPLPHPIGRIPLLQIRLDQSAVRTHILGQRWSEGGLRAFLGIQRWRVPDMLRYVASPPAPPLPPAEEGVFSFGSRLGFFGGAAPRFGSLPVGTNLKSDPYTSDWDAAGAGLGRTVWTDSQGADYATADAYLERAVPGIPDDSWALIESDTQALTAYRIRSTEERALADYAISGRATGLRLANPDGGEGSAAHPDGFRVRSSVAYVESRRLTLADMPIEDALEAGDTELTLGGLVLGLSPGQALALTGTRLDLPGVEGSEVLLLEGIAHDGGFTVLTFTTGLQHGYERASVTINANVTAATHGETTCEVLGGGDASKPNQRFTLKKWPLTYVAARTASGAASTLQLRVDGVLWEQRPRLYDLGSADRGYITRIEEDAKASVVFGDGRRGARPPSGVENVTATYRTGIGMAGMVGARRLTLLQTRPFGVRSVTNAVPAAGAAEPESRDDARVNAPRTVLTMDRIVSLRDYEDFAAGFAGVGKAQAVALERGSFRLVHVSAASASGDPIGPTDPLRGLLSEAIQAARDPARPFALDTFLPLFFDVRARVLVDSRYVEEDVLAAAQLAILERFSFAMRAFGQPVTSAEVVTVVQGVEGVVAVDLIDLHVVVEGVTVSTVAADVLPAHRARLADPLPGVPPAVLLAELLLVNPAGITLERMTP